MKDTMLRNSDVATMMRKVRGTLSRARRERDDGVLFIELESLDRFGLDALRRDARLVVDLPSGSGRPVIGPVIVFSKRVFRRLVRWYVKPIALQQSGVNERLLDVDARVAGVAARAEAGVTDLLIRLEELEHEVDRLSSEAPRRAQQSRPDSDESSALDLSVQRLLAYSGFEDRHRGSQEVVRPLLATYLKYFEDSKAVVDLGSGRGEFVSVLEEAGIHGYGVDSDESQVATARAAGRDVRLEDAVEHLHGLGVGEVDGVFSSQVAEHLTTNELMTTIDLVRRKLAPGGVFVMETPNPEALFIFSTFFYVDLTHIKPIHPEALRWAFEACGFDDVQIVRTQKVPDSARLQAIPAELRGEPGWDVVGHNLDMLNDLIYGYQHYAVVGRKPEAGSR
ncbi:class I SAM-dependent methyltransferase [Pengzhenrongella sicca]|uniref:Class I SAM-dependent methyltransferase n=1 Tax=Pengzhenrongella sicca TaxID=2819238 RepID=A0A8A4ZI80_9MICO|nr:class I SAM-dependent methyltransferase [Pengzhenrongella sicca]QTE30227.1 class I SAM-dependent methyltransferase [Pengzhenrongella sicca]